MPLYFSHHSPGQVPTLGLIGKVMVGDDRLPGWPFGRTLQQGLDLLLNYLIGGKPYLRPRGQDNGRRLRPSGQGLQHME